MQSISDLIRNIGSGRAAHAYIIEGRSGDPRDSFVQTLVSGLECDAEDPGARPCGSCPSCRQVAAGTCMDVVRMSKSTGRSGNESYKTSDAADLIERLSMDPYGRYLIGIIDDADSLSETIQNKLLKTLEEPPGRTILLLTASNRDNLLETVRSRCSVIRLSDYAEDAGDGRQAVTEIHSTAEMLISRKCRFCEFREAADKNIKSKEDAKLLLDALGDLAAEIMKDGAADRARAQEMARVIEISEKTRADIARDMNYSRALRRLYLELR